MNFLKQEQGNLNYTLCQHLSWTAREDKCISFSPVAVSPQFPLGTAESRIPLSSHLQKSLNQQFLRFPCWTSQYFWRFKGRSIKRLRGFCRCLSVVGHVLICVDTVLSLASSAFSPVTCFAGQHDRFTLENDSQSLSFLTCILHGKAPKPQSSLLNRPLVTHDSLCMEESLSSCFDCL